jgi:hypothetical protein
MKLLTPQEKTMTTKKTQEENEKTELAPLSLSPIHTSKNSNNWPMSLSGGIFSNDAVVVDATTTSSSPSSSGTTTASSLFQKVMTFSSPNNWLHSTGGDHRKESVPNRIVAPRKG